MAGGRWNKKKLTYSITGYDNIRNKLTRNQVDITIRKAFNVGITMLQILE